MKKYHQMNKDRDEPIERKLKNQKSERKVNVKQKETNNVQ